MEDNFSLFCPSHGPAILREWTVVVATALCCSAGEFESRQDPGVCKLLSVAKQEDAPIVVIRNITADPALYWCVERKAETTLPEACSCPLRSDQLHKAWPEMLPVILVA